nr:hypothetical protein [uncultured Prevotella sp.]
MKTLKEINAESKKYAPDDEGKREAFVQGARYALTGRYYKEASMYPDLAVLGECTISHVEEAPSFEDFWNAYDYKKGRKKSEEKWNRLSFSEKVACMKAIPEYVASTIKAGQPQDNRNYKPYRAHPLTYLNGARWEDEIETPTSNEQQRAQRLAERTRNLINSAFQQ